MVDRWPRIQTDRVMFTGRYRRTLSSATDRLRIGSNGRGGNRVSDLGPTEGVSR